MIKFSEDDQSDYLIHLVSKDQPFESFTNILYSGVIEARTAFGLKAQTHQKKSVCFTEIPPAFLKKLIERREAYGIAFNKKWLLEKEAQRVWYIEKDSQTHTSLERLFVSLNNVQKQDFFNLAPFIDIPGEYQNSTYRFEWEREWRIIGDLSFSPDDVEFLILPSEDHDGARYFFYDAAASEEGPNYTCPYYDPITNSCNTDTGNSPEN